MNTVRRSAAVTLLCLLGLLSVSSTALADSVTPRADRQSFVTSDALVPVLDGPDGKHEATIDTRLYVPSGATAAKPQPAILMTHGFGLSKTAAEVVSMATFLARHGYVVLTYTAQGFGDSSGCVTLQSRDFDVKDAQQLITKVLDPRKDVQHDASGSVVGMVGGSYGGGIQANVAENDRRIHAIAPGRTWNSLQYSLDPNNRIVPGDPTGFSHELNPQGVFKLQWTSLFFASGNLNPIGGIPGPAVPQPQGACAQDKLLSPPGVAVSQAGVVCPGVPLQVCETYAKLTLTGDADGIDRSLLYGSSAQTQIDKLRIPVLLTQGLSDTLFNVNDAAATYTELRRRGVPVKMIWNSGGHGGYNSLPGECEVYGGGTGGADYSGLDDCYLTLRTLAFFDQALRGKPDPSPGFTFYRDWVPYSGKGANDEQYGSAPAFPIRGVTTYTLSGSKALVTSGATAGSANFTNPPGGLPPAYSETSNFSGPSSSPRIPIPPTEQPGQSVSFTSEPFASDLVSVGVPSARLKISRGSVPNPNDLVFFGKVFDVAPDGSATLIHRLIAPVRVPAAALGDPVELKLLGFAHRFDQGHSVRLTLAATDATSYNAKLADQIIVTTGAGSTFTLPGTLAAPIKTSVPHTDGIPRRPLPATGGAPLVPLAGMGLLLAAVVLRRRRIR